ncbi:hypothetical protein D9M68_868270 [compost metagenome]
MRYQSCRASPVFIKLGVQLPYPIQCGLRLLGDVASGLQVSSILVVAGDSNAGLCGEAVCQVLELLFDRRRHGVGDYPLVGLGRVCDGVINQPTEEVQWYDIELGVLDKGLQRRDALAAFG